MFSYEHLMLVKLSYILSHDIVLVRKPNARQTQLYIIARYCSRTNTKHSSNSVIYYRTIFFSYEHLTLARNSYICICATILFSREPDHKSWPEPTAAHIRPRTTKRNQYPAAIASARIFSPVNYRPHRAVSSLRYSYKYRKRTWSRWCSYQRL